MSQIKLVMISLILFVLSCVGCSHTAPKYPTDTRRSFYINNGSPYLRYEYVFNSKVKWNLPLTQDESLKHICTYREDYEKMWAYGEKVKKYVIDLETDLAKCKAK